VIFLFALTFSYSKENPKKREKSKARLRNEKKMALENRKNFVFSVVYRWFVKPSSVGDDILKKQNKTNKNNPKRFMMVWYL